MNNFKYTILFSISALVSLSGCTAAVDNNKYYITDASIDEINARCNNQKYDEAYVRNNHLYIKCGSYTAKYVPNPETKQYDVIFIERKEFE